MLIRNFGDCFKSMEKMLGREPNKYAFISHFDSVDSARPHQVSLCNEDDIEWVVNYL